MANSAFRLLFGLLCIAACNSLLGNKNVIKQQQQQLNSIALATTKADDTRALERLQAHVQQELTTNESNFYNYSLICGGGEYESRVNKDKTFVDATIPAHYRTFVLSTYLDASERENACPRWTSTYALADDASSSSSSASSGIRSGSMEQIKLAENTPVGTRVYTLSAVDSDTRPIYYFVRRAESEVEAYPSERLIFHVVSKRLGTHTWIGEVFLNASLDYETKTHYSYLAYAFDGTNMLEKYSSVEVSDVDDERPRIHTASHPAFNATLGAFRFRINETASINDIINPSEPVVVTDVDTQRSQLRMRLLFVDTGLAHSPFSMSNSGELRIINNLDYELQREYLLKLIVRDTADHQDEAYIFVELVDVADMPPRFVKPYQPDQSSSTSSSSSFVSAASMFNNRLLVSEHAQYVTFYENKLGKVCDVEAVSANRHPHGPITYELVATQPRDYMNNFELKQSAESGGGWYLDCVSQISLNGKRSTLNSPGSSSFGASGSGDDELIRVRLRAVEPTPDDQSRSAVAQLSTERVFNIRLLNGDACAPQFDKTVYEFTVVEMSRQLIEPIFVKDCDFGENGRIQLSSTHPDFKFKLDTVTKNIFSLINIVVFLLSSIIRAN